MKIQISATFITAAALSIGIADGAAMINQGTYVTDFAEPCLEVIAANDFYGDCCSFSDINAGGNKCRLTIAGQDNGCGWNNKQYMEDCAQAGGCLAGPYVGVYYEDGEAVEECPASQYDWEVPATSPPTSEPTGEFYDVTYVANDACPSGGITAVVKDSQGQPVVGVYIGFLLVGNESNSPYEGQVFTDASGSATFEFTASDVDAGETLWCSMAVENPELPFDQAGACSVSVCKNSQPDCVQTTTPFDAGWGTCETYAQDINLNYDYCDEDADDSGLHASEACAECGKCKQPKPTTNDSCPTETPFGFPTCEGDLECEYGEETCCGETHPSVICHCSGGSFGCYYTEACYNPQC